MKNYQNKYSVSCNLKHQKHWELHGFSLSENLAIVVWTVFAFFFLLYNLQ